jgi:hypothetical protein
VNFQLAAVAGAGVNLPDRKAAAESAVRGAVETLCEFGKSGIVGLRRGVRHRRPNQVFEQNPAHRVEP